MSEIERIGDQMDRAFDGEAWHGPPVLHALEGVKATAAALRPIAGAHTIWEIVLHIAAWKEIVTRRLRGEMVVDVPDDVDWPPVTKTTDAAWREALNRLRVKHQELRAVVADIQDGQLDEPPAKGTSTRYRLLHGVIQHDLYHAGQIAVLRKAK